MPAIKIKPGASTKHSKPAGQAPKSKKGYKGFASYKEYYKAVILGPAEDLYAVMTGKVAPPSDDQGR